MKMSGLTIYLNFMQTGSLRLIARDRNMDGCQSMSRDQSIDNLTTTAKSNFKQVHLNADVRFHLKSSKTLKHHLDAHFYLRQNLNTHVYNLIN